MSTKETPMVRAWWEAAGGRICEEYPLVAGVRGEQQRRRVDGLVNPALPTVWLDDWRAFGSTEGQDLVVVQAKASRLSAPLLGQAMFSRDLALTHLKARSVQTI